MLAQYMIKILTSLEKLLVMLIMIMPEIWTKKKSLTRYVFTLCGSVISWKVTLQFIVALSTTEAEYMATIEAMKKSIWLKGLVGDLGLQQVLTIVYFNSQSVIHLTKNQMFYEKTKHVDVRMHFIRDVIAQGAIVLKKIPMVDNPTNMMTKSIPMIKFKHCLNLIGVSSI